MTTRDLVKRGDTMTQHEHAAAFVSSFVSLAADQIEREAGFRNSYENSPKLAILTNDWINGGIPT